MFSPWAGSTISASNVGLSPVTAASFTSTDRRNYQENAVLNFMDHQHDSFDKSEQT